MNDDDPMHKIAAWDWLAVIVIVAASLGLWLTAGPLANM